MKIIFSNKKEFSVESVREQYFEIDKEDAVRLTIVPVDAFAFDEFVAESKNNGSNDIVVTDDNGNIKDTFTGYSFMQASKNYQLDSNSDIEFICSVQFCLI